MYEAIVRYQTKPMDAMQIQAKIRGRIAAENLGACIGGGFESRTGAVRMTVELGAKTPKEAKAQRARILAIAEEVATARTRKSYLQPFEITVSED